MIDNSFPSHICIIVFFVLFLLLDISSIAGVLALNLLIAKPGTGSGVVSIDPLCFLAGCCTRRLNQALSVLSLSLGFF